MDSQILIYGSYVYSSADVRVCLCLLKSDERPIQRFIEISSLGRFVPFLKAKNVQGWNVYVTPSVLKLGAIRRTKDNFLDTQDVIYIDCDDKRAMEEVKARYPHPCLVVKTSTGRYQIYWKLSEPITISEQEELMRRIAIDVKADRAATDVSRLLRLPSFWNRKLNRHNTVDIVFKRDCVIDYKNLSSLSLSSVGVSSCTSKASSLSPFQCAKKGNFALRGDDEEKFVFPSKSEEDWYLVNQMLRDGASREDCIAFLFQRRKGEKRDLEYYAMYTVDKAIKLGGKNL